MGVFSPLEVRATKKWVGGRRIWELVKDLVYEADDGTTYTVPAGFTTDFASAPRVPVAWETGGDVGHRAAVLHDYLYHYHHRYGMSREEVDALFRRALRDDGVGPVRAWMMWAAVRAFGWASWL